MRADKIFLVGFMAAGKSTVAKALAHKLDRRVEDSDELIEKRERKTVADIFDRHGELYFRTSERAVIQELAPLQHVVIATGGGTFTIQENRTVINQIGVSVANLGMAEALMLAAASGLDVQRVLDAISGGAAGSGPGCSPLSPNSPESPAGQKSRGASCPAPTVWCHPQTVNGSMSAVGVIRHSSVSRVERRPYK